MRSDQSVILEGFYGKPWTFAQRELLIRLLASPQALNQCFGFESSLIHDQVFSAYCYAPKQDKYLRSRWCEPWPDESFAHLQKLSTLACKLDVGFMVGFSPLGLYERWVASPESKAQATEDLHARLHQFMQLGITGLGLFFDDMTGDYADLAAVQGEVVDTVQSFLPEVKLYFCPSYYSYDLVLEEVFGVKPESYWEDLGNRIDADVEMFWTGDKVISQSYSPSSLLSITQTFKRKPVIWDNSCVNDGRKTADFLPIRSPVINNELLEAQFGFVNVPNSSVTVPKRFLNPSNAFGIALLSLMATSQLQRLSPIDLTRLLPSPLADFFDVHLEVIAHTGLSNISPAQRTSMLDDLIACRAHHANSVGGDASQSIVTIIVDDVLAWLAGDYQFDPNCLTE